MENQILSKKEVCTFSKKYVVCELQAVSYTHLDVYKRQVVEFPIPIGVGEDRLRERGSLPATVFYQG